MNKQRQQISDNNKFFWSKIRKAVNSDPKSVLYENTEDSPTLEQAREFVGGYIELVHTQYGAQLIVDEEGGFKPDLEVNSVASFLYGGEIVGNAIILVGDAKWT